MGADRYRRGREPLQLIVDLDMLMVNPWVKPLFPLLVGIDLEPLVVGPDQWDQ